MRDVESYLSGVERSKAERNEISPILLPSFNFRHLGNFSRKRVKVLSSGEGRNLPLANFPRIYSRGDIKSVEDACEDIQ